jgi:hypothetical protein
LLVCLVSDSVSEAFWLLLPNSSDFPEIIFSDVIITLSGYAKYYILSERDSRFGIGPNGSNT